MYARRTSKLCQARNREFDLFAHVHHEIGKLVDDDDDIGQLFEHLSVLRILLSCLLALLSLRIVLTDVARTKAREHFEPALHFSDRPRERTRCFTRFGHNGNVKMRDAVIGSELDALRVDHDEAHLSRCCAHENRHDHSVDGD